MRVFFSLDVIAVAVVLCVRSLSHFVRFVHLTILLLILICILLSRAKFRMINAVFRRLSLIGRRRIC